MPRLRPRAVTLEFPAITRNKILIDKNLNDEAKQPPAGSGAAPQPAANETYISKIIAYIPIESVALYQAAFNQLGPDDPLFWPVSLVILCVTPLWQLWATRDGNERYAWDQAVVSAPAFVFWLMGLQSPLVKSYFGAHLLPWKESYGTFFLLVGSLVLPVLGWIVIQIEGLIRRALARKAGS
jgi:hypothetical protein